MSDSPEDTGLKRRRMAFFTLVAVWLALDLASKVWLFALLGAPDSPAPGGPYGQIKLLDGFFQLSGQVNAGAAFGLGSGHRWAVLGLSALLLPILTAMALREREKGAPLWALGAVVGGALGNLHDRVFETGVRDFLEIVKPWAPDETLWPVFNVADIGIVGGMAVYFMWAMMHKPIKN